MFINLGMQNCRFKKGLVFTFMKILLLVVERIEYAIVKECNSGTPLFMNVVKESVFNKCSYRKYYGV
jgi:hypothetical protein